MLYSNENSFYLLQTTHYKFLPNWVHRAQNIVNAKSCYTLFLKVMSKILYHNWELFHPRQHYIVIKLLLRGNVFRHHAIFMEHYNI